MAEAVIVYSGELVSRKDAKARGLARYFTGKPCCCGHVAQRFVSSKCCVVCAGVRALTAKRSHPEKQAEYAQHHREKLKRENPELWAARQNEVREKKRQKYFRRPMTAVELEIERKRTLKNFHARREREAGSKRPDVCEVCSEKGRIEFDHCHSSGRFRGWLCARCNRTLGFVKDSPKLLLKLAAYLEKANGAAHHGEEK